MVLIEVRKNWYNKSIIILGIFFLALSIIIVICSRNSSAGLSLGSLTLTAKDSDPLHDGYCDQVNITQYINNNNSTDQIVYDVHFLLNDSAGHTVMISHGLGFILNPTETNVLYCDLNTTYLSSIGNYTVTVIADGHDSSIHYYDEKSSNIYLYPIGYYSPELRRKEVLQAAEPGLSVTFNITVKNNGNCPDTINLRAESQHHWQATLNKTLVGPLQPGENGYVLLIVTIPLFVEPDYQDQETISARSTKDASSETMCWAISKSAPFTANLSISCDNTSKYIEPGGNMTYNLTIMNNGKYNDTVTISADQPLEGWSQYISNSTMDVQLNSSRVISFILTAPTIDVSWIFMITNLSVTSQDHLTIKNISIIAKLLISDLLPVTWIGESAIMFSNDIPVAGQNITVTISITNNGTKTALNPEVAFYNEKGKIGSIYIKKISLGEIVNASIIWAAFPGNTIFTVKIDPNNTILEINDQNNRATRPIQVIAPDFTLAPIDIVFGTQKPNEGEVVNMSILVHNIGDSDGLSLKVIFLIDDTIVNNSNILLNEIKKGSTGTVIFTWSATWGNHSVKVRLDPDNSIMEFNEGNNNATTQIYINRRPNPTAEADRTVAYVNTSITISAANSSDSDGKVAQYYYDFGDGQSSNWINNSTVQHKYNKSGQFNIRIKIKDNNGGESFEYFNLAITINNHQPPTAVKINQSANITKTSMIISWSKNENDDFSVYEIHLSKKKNFSPSKNTLFNAIEDQNTISSNITGLSSGTKYYIVVRVVNTDKLSTDSSELETKTKGEPTPKSPGYESIMMIGTLSIIFIILGYKRRILH